MLRLTLILAVIFVASVQNRMALADSKSPGIVKTEFVFETAPFRSCHASTIVETKDGFVCAWFGGTAEKNPDVGIWVSRFVGTSWTAPVEAVNGVESDTVRYACWNPVLFQPKDGPLWLFYKVGKDVENWWGMLVTSDDQGKTWSKPRRLPDGLLGPIKNKPVQLESGEILSPTSSEHDGWKVHFERSADMGKTWTATGPLNDGTTISAIQPSILFHKDGTLQAVGRTRQKKVFSITSSDQGKTWGTMTLTSLPNPNSGTDAVTLTDGRQLIVYNHTPKGRTPLNVSVSANGQDWQAALVLETEPGEYSYPAVIQARNGLVHMVYTWKRERIRHVVADPKLFKTSPIVDGVWPESAK